MGRLKRNKQAIERYVTILQPKLERQTGGMINLEELDKPESSPPCTDNALDLMGNAHNADAAQKLEPVFRDMVLNGDVAQGYMMKLLGVAGLRQGDPGAVRRWRAGETEDDKLLARFFDRAVKYVAEELERRHPGTEIKVVLDPEDDPVNSPGQSAERERRWGEQDSYRHINAAVKGIMQEEGCSIEAAIGLYRDRLARDKRPDVSPRKIYRARTFVKEERESA